MTYSSLSSSLSHTLSPFFLCSAPLLSGVPSHLLFNADDLVDHKNSKVVTNCLLQLARIGNSKYNLPAIRIEAGKDGAAPTLSSIIDEQKEKDRKFEEDMKQAAANREAAAKDNAQKDQHGKALPSPPSLTTQTSASASCVMRPLSVSPTGTPTQQHKPKDKKKKKEPKKRDDSDIPKPSKLEPVKILGFKKKVVTELIATEEVGTAF